MGIPLLRGRFYTESEPVGLRPVVVNESFAKRMWPNVADPLGRRIRARGDTSSTHWLTVLGVTKDEKHYGAANPSRPGIYMALTLLDKNNDITPLTFVVHTASDPTSLFAPIREAVRELDPELPLFELRTMQEAMERSLALRRMMATALAAFAGIALTLAIGGIYAVLSYVVGRRRHEIGIRMALGAQRGQVVQLVVRQGLRLVGLGVLVGLPLAFLAARVLSSILIGVSPRDPITYAGVALLLAFTGIAAALVPARRAARVEPTVALAEG
jgi:putative ABC transport system permease protein